MRTAHHDRQPATFYKLRVGPRPGRDCPEKIFTLVAQAFQPVPRQMVNRAQPGKAVPPSKLWGTARHNFSPENPVCLPSSQRPLLIYNLRPVHGKEKAPPAPELAGRDRQTPGAGSKFMISWPLSEKNLLPDLLPDNFLGKIIRGTHPDA